MKKLKYILVLLLGVTVFLADCSKDDDWLIVCDSCPSSKPWSVWSIDLSNPCFSTKSECEAWAKSHVPGDQWKCELCND